MLFFLKKQVIVCYIVSLALTFSFIRELGEDSEGENQCDNTQNTLQSISPMILGINNNKQVKFTFLHSIGDNIISFSFQIKQTRENE